MGWQSIRGFTALIALLCVALIGCAEETATENRGGPETNASGTASPVSDREFGLLRYASDPEALTPTLCLVFSEALDPAVDYRPYLGIDRQVALSVDRQRLCVGGLSYGETVALTVREGLPAADGDELSADENLTLTFEDRPARVGFSGNGIILPRIKAEGLAIETVNVDEIEIAISRVTDRALVFRSLTEGFESLSGRYTYTPFDEEPGSVGSPVYEGRLATPGDTNETVTTVFPIMEAIGTLEPGAYFVTLEDAEARARGERQPAQAARWVIVTDLAFTAYRGADGLTTTVRSLDTAQPQSRIEVQLVAQSNEILATARTGSDGRVSFDAPLLRGEGGDRPHMLMAYGPDNDFAVLDLTRAPVDLTNQPIGGRSRPKGAEAFVYLDRGIYRPGEDVHVGTLLRDAAGMAISDRPGTVTLYRPNGLIHEEIRFERLSEAGGDSFTFAIPRAGPRGRWRIEVSADGLGSVGGESFVVEDFVPQRIDLTLSADTETPIRPSETRAISASVRFLYGAPGAGLPVSGTARVQPQPNPFPQFEGFSFGRHDEQFSEYMIDLAETAADGDGNATLPLEIGTRGTQSSLPLRARVVIRAEEPGGRAVADDIRIPYRPRDLYVGLSPAFDGAASQDAENVFRVMSVDTTGTPIEATLDWTLVRRDYNYDWYRTEGGDWQWRRDERVVPIETGRVSPTSETPGEITLPALDWGDYSLLVRNNDTIIASSGFWVGWGGRTSDGVEAPDEVRVSGPETPPSIGDEATITLRAPYGGEAEIVVATDRVLETRHISLPEGGGAIDLPVTEDWGAGAYILASVYTPRDVDTQPRPRRAVGVAYVPTDIKDRSMALSLETPDVLRPNQTVEIDLNVETAPSGETVYATVAAVDEGILLLTGFESPDADTAFFGKPALDIALYDDYGRLLDPNQGAAAALRGGGDQIGGAGLSVVPTKTVALYSGVIDVGRDGRASVPLDLPDFNGKLRLMAVVWSQSGVGDASRPVTVRDPVPAELILPRFLAPGDTALATATLDNIEGPPGRYTVGVNADGPVDVTDVPAGPDLERGERWDERVALKADTAGVAALTLDVTGPGGFTAASEYPIEVRGAHWPLTQVQKVTLAPGEAFTPTSEFLDPFTEGTGYLQISLASTPIDTAALYKSLADYPFACTEQLVSQALPLLYAGSLGQQAQGATATSQQPSVQTAVETLLSRQGNNGAFGLWRVGDNDASPWIGAYAADFLLRAEAAGVAVPNQAKTRALDALLPVAAGELYRAYGYQTSIGNPRYTEDTQQRLTFRSAAYANYVLARAGRADVSRVRYMHDAQLDEMASPLARAHLGGALAAIGDKGRARSAFQAAIDALGYTNRGDWYQTPRRDLAGVLALAIEAGETDIAAPLLDRVSRTLPEPQRLTTQEKAFLILAAQAFTGGDGELDYTYAGTPSAGLSYAFNDVTLPEAQAFENAGSTPLYLTAMATGTPASAPPAASEGIIVEKTILTPNGQPADLSGLSQGQRLIVSLTLAPAREARAAYALVDLLPAGFEIETVLQRADGAPDGPYAFLGELSSANITEKRDDRFVAAIETRASEPGRFAYVVRAVTPGSFTLPGAVGEDMYAPTVFGRTASGQITIAP